MTNDRVTPGSGEPAIDTVASGTERERIERLLIHQFPAIKPLEPADLVRVAPYKNGGFMPSVLGFMLYCNGYSLRGTSRLCRNGLLYDDGETLFGIGIFRKTIETPIWHVMVSGPWGKDGFAKVDHLVTRLRELGVTSEIFVRHLGAADYLTFYSHDYRYIRESPWCVGAPAEDETHNYKRIRLSDVIAVDANGQVEIKTMQGEEDRGFRVKARMVFNRFSNFLERNHLSFTIRDYTMADLPVAENLVRHHFALLKNPVGSTPEDYMSLLRCDPAALGDQEFGKIGFLEDGKVSIPALLFLGEHTGGSTVSLYATFANRDPETLDASFDTTGFSAISQYSYLILFKMLLDIGIEWVDVGGSETQDLDKFKRQLGATEVPSYWVVAPTAATPGEPP